MTLPVRAPLSHRSDNTKGTSLKPAPQTATGATLVSVPLSKTRFCDACGHGYSGACINKGTKHKGCPVSPPGRFL